MLKMSTFPMRRTVLKMKIKKDRNRLLFSKRPGLHEKKIGRYVQFRTKIEVYLQCIFKTRVRN
jgi:hypothetical protein